MRSQSIQNYIKHVFTTRSCGMHDVALAERAIKWVLCSFQPLESHILLEAIRYDTEGSRVVQKEPQTQERILSLCQDLLTLDQATKVWTLPHASVAEYFLSEVWTSWKCDVFASKVCLGVLESPQPERREKSNFADYAHLYWGKHVQRYEQWLETTKKKRVDTNLTVALEHFLVSPGKSSGNYRKWAESGFMGERFRPSNMALFAMCRYGFYYTLRDWWRGGTINMEMALRNNEEGYNSLALAVQSDCKPICKHLVELINARHPDANRHAGALKTAIEENNFEMLEFLMSNTEASVNHAPRGMSRYKSRYANATAAQYAAGLRPGMLQWMVDQNLVYLERENDNGYDDGNILIAAVSEGKVDSVEILLEAGANVNAAVHNGRYGSALVSAARNGDPDIVDMLLKKGADPNLPLKGGDYGSAFEASVATRSNSNEENRRKVQQLLLKAGANSTAIFGQGVHSPRQRSTDKKKSSRT
ncbi:hypothetical protein THAR02_11119 [Trichoderma harzianum]|uniref:GPI inositol-deacylase winged helix domain-containing protein n=1 Tax=Trichoderma harzianum TaxID=5544 RepID=A0A0F9Z846_TRIHA|nr:hypothetical protein THAR02_11119 [Trichoderma harzianum]